MLSYIYRPHMSLSYDIYLSHMCDVYLSNDMNIVHDFINRKYRTV